MLISNIIVTLTSFQLVIGQSYNRKCPQGVKIRKNIVSFSSGELKRWIDVTRRFSKTARFNELAKIHHDNDKYIHGVEMLLPWHRKFLAVYEDELLKLDSSVVLPFVDWTEHSSRPHEHPVFLENMYGGNGNRDNNWCLENGPFANITITNPDRHCLKRKYDKNDNTELSAFSPKEDVQSRISGINRYTDFRQSIEGNPHALPHCYIGGFEFDFYHLYSPSDPIFYLHHGFIDNMWYQWQSKDESRFQEYNSDREDVSIHDALVDLDGTVGDVLDPRQGPLCYEYEPWGTDVESSLEKSPAMQNEQNSRSSDRQGSIWDKIKALPFDKEADKIPNIELGTSRSSKCLIPKPGKLSENVLKMRRIDPVKYEADRMMSVKVIDILNADPNYRPAKGC